MAAGAQVVDVSQDWMIACEVQERFMHTPGVTVETLTYDARCRQVRALGGDCFDFLPLSGNRVAVAVGDASGKGLPAALMIANVHSSLRTAASFAPDDTAAVVAAVNRQVHSSSTIDCYATLFYGVFDGATRRLQYINAGHHPPIIIQRSRLVAKLDAGGPPVGIFGDSTYQTGIVQLNFGDLIVAYTDGVVEALNVAGKEWGTEGILAAVAQSHAQRPDEIVDAIFTSLDEFSRGHQTDDATVVVARVE